MPTYLFSYIEYNTSILITYVFLFFNIYTFLITIKKTIYYDDWFTIKRSMDDENVY